ncbi:hypothetical protein Bbelb_005220 [Branchiostoma belcheri]|nr:hypothetical protein Bbelb_005220 [Branchiostoma belcheri]
MGREFVAAYTRKARRFWEESGFFRHRVSKRQPRCSPSVSNNSEWRCTCGEYGQTVPVWSQIRELPHTSSPHIPVGFPYPRHALCGRSPTVCDLNKRRGDGVISPGDVSRAEPPDSAAPASLSLIEAGYERVPTRADELLELAGRRRWIGSAPCITSPFFLAAPGAAGRSDYVIRSWREQGGGGTPCGDAGKVLEVPAVLNAMLERLFHRI